MSARRDELLLVEGRGVMSRRRFGLQQVRRRRAVVRLGRSHIGVGAAKRLEARIAGEERRAELFAGGGREDGEVGGVLEVGRLLLLVVGGQLLLRKRGQVVVAVELGRIALVGLVASEGLLGLLGLLRIQEVGAGRAEGGEVLGGKLLARRGIQIDAETNVGGHGRRRVAVSYKRLLRMARS